MKILKIIVISAVFAFLLNMFFGRIFLANLSTWPILNRLKILDPQAPIVINNREEIRLTDSGQAVDAVNIAKSKIAAVYVKSSDSLKQTGAAINLSSDGSFVTVKEAVSAKGDYFVVLNDGRSQQVSQMFFDPASSLVFLKSSFQNLPTADFSDSKNLQSGEKLFYYSLLGDKANFWPDVIISPEDSRQDQVLAAGKVNRKIVTANAAQDLSSFIALDIKGQVAGILSSGQIIPADAIKSASSIYLNSQTLLRPDFEFTYKQISSQEAKILNQNPEPVVLASFNKQNQLKAGDSIVSVGGQNLNSNFYLEELLEKYKPGDSVEFVVNRQGQNLTITIKPKELK